MGGGKEGEERGDTEARWRKREGGSSPGRGNGRVKELREGGGAGMGEEIDGRPEREKLGRSARRAGGERGKGVRG